MSTNTEYDQIKAISRHFHLLSGIRSLLDWDRETYMPDAAAEIRAEQIQTLVGITHKERTSKKFAQSLNKLIDIETGKVKASKLDASQKAALKAWRRDYLQDIALPKKFVEEFAKVTSQAHIVWRTARERNTFHQFAPFLDKILSMNRQKADLLGYKNHPYDALLDLFEPDSTAKEISHLFKDLRIAIVHLLKKISSAKPIDDRFLHGKFSPEKQVSVSKKILTAMGCDPLRGRLDFSAHPFSSACHPTDSRITTRIHPTSLISNISATLHEGGHSLYETGLPIEQYGTPLGESISLGVHESQSRWWEILIGKSKPFWHHFLPVLQQEFKGNLHEVDLETFYRAVNKVEPSYIRIEADEVTYPLHIILRFEIEMALIEGSLKVRDLPEAWNEKMRDLLGITPKTNREGCLQDVHWSMGAFGYFPTYALGNIYAAQMFEAFEQQFPDWAKKAAQGQLLFIKDWLSKEVFQYGRRYNSAELIKKTTGHPINTKPYIQYLNTKYSKIYQLGK